MLKELGLRQEADTTADFIEPGLRLLVEAGWAPAGVFCANFLLLMLGWYPVHMDSVLHFVGGMAIAYFFDRALWVYADQLGRPIDLVCRLLVLTLSATAALFWEFGEFLAEPMVILTLQPSLEDTLLDLTLGLFGAAIYVVGSHAGTLHRADPN